MAFFWVAPKCHYLYGIFSLGPVSVLYLGIISLAPNIVQVEKNLNFPTAGPLLGTQSLFLCRSWYSLPANQSDNWQVQDFRVQSTWMSLLTHNVNNCLVDCYKTTSFSVSSAFRHMALLHSRAVLSKLAYILVSFWKHSVFQR